MIIALIYSHKRKTFGTLTLLLTKTTDQLLISLIFFTKNINLNLL